MLSFISSCRDLWQSLQHPSQASGQVGAEGAGALAEGFKSKPSSACVAMIYIGCVKYYIHFISKDIRIEIHVKSITDQNIYHFISFCMKVS